MGHIQGSPDGNGPPLEVRGSPVKIGWSEWPRMCPRSIFRSIPLLCLDVPVYPSNFCKSQTWDKPRVHPIKPCIIYSRISDRWVPGTQDRGPRDKGPWECPMGQNQRNQPIRINFFGLKKFLIKMWCYSMHFCNLLCNNAQIYWNLKTFFSTIVT